MSFIKQTLKNTASLVLAAGIIGTAYAAITTVNSGDTLTASSWNEVVSKLTNTDTNSTDLVTKSYVDSTVSASSGGGGYANCEAKHARSTSTLNLTCSAGKSIRSHSYMCGQGSDAGGTCGINSLTTTGLIGAGHYQNYNGSTNDATISASIICCDD